MKSEKSYQQKRFHTIQQKLNRGDRSYMNDNRQSFAKLASMKEAILQGRFLNSTTLRNNILGLTVAYQAHHIIPSQVIENKLPPNISNQNKEVIGKYYDQAWNGIALPSADANATALLPSHRGFHSQYNRAVDAAWGTQGIMPHPNINFNTIITQPGVQNAAHKLV